MALFKFYVISALTSVIPKLPRLKTESQKLLKVPASDTQNYSKTYCGFNQKFSFLFYSVNAKACKKGSVLTRLIGQRDPGITAKQSGDGTIEHVRWFGFPQLFQVFRRKQYFKRKHLTSVL